MSNPLPDRDIGCHRTGFQMTCFKGVTEHRCRLWQHLTGKDPQTDASFDFFGCADEFRTKLQLELSQQMRQAGASTDKVATEIQNFHRKMVNMNQGAIHQQKVDALLEGPESK